jgi:hypothetical protein
LPCFFLLSWLQVLTTIVTTFPSWSAVAYDSGVTLESGFGRF